jgi:TPR repeat protein
VGHEPRAKDGMKRTSKAAVTALVLPVGLAGSVAAGPMRMERPLQGSVIIDTAMRLVRPLADRGDHSAQAFLGHMFWVIIPPDYAAAASWYSKASQQHGEHQRRYVMSKIETANSPNPNP